MLISEYPHRTQPFPHQLKHLVEKAERTVWGLRWEQGCAKTKPTIDTFAFLYFNGKVDAMLVIAPNGVHRNWTSDELPAHLPHELLRQARIMHWDNSKKKTKAAIEERKLLLSHKGPVVLTAPYSIFTTTDGKNFIWSFFKRRKVMYVLDEAHHIKTPGISRTKSIIKSAQYATYRRILTGTLVAQRPFDCYAPIRFLDPTFWARRGMGTFAAFKAYFGIFTKGQQHYIEQDEKGNDVQKVREYDVLVDYRNLDKLADMIALISDRVEKVQVLPDLPPKLYQKRYFKLTPALRKAYNELRDDYMLQLDSGNIIEAELAIVRLTKLQQITCGYVVTDSLEPVEVLEDPNPRIELLKEILEELDAPVIIFCRFKEDVNQIMKAIPPKWKAVRYDGSISADAAAKAKQAFQDGTSNAFVTTLGKGSEGLTLIRATTVVYYSNDFKLVQRIQSEDRPHRPGQKNAVTYIDIIAEGTCDVKIIKSLRTNFDIAQRVNRDVLREWL